MKKNLGSGSRALPPPSPSPSFPADSVRGIRSPSRNLRGKNAAREGEGGRRGRGIFDVSLSEAVDFHMVEGGGRACEVGLEVGAASPRRAGAGRDLGPRDARGEGPGPQPREPCRPPAPGRASPGHSPPRRWPPPCAPRPPSPSCPPGSPRAGGGNPRHRQDSARPAAGRSGGGAGRGGKERATRCVGQRAPALGKNAPLCSDCYCLSCSSTLQLEAVTRVLDRREKRPIPQG
ncbi:translation initiation factor IF-2-like, partial [Lontra canadensis]|uniref:translation initiation factor IF-2-like n=1 Tax=Lontra canadensis TaxID=76717 RepID=UPI0013F31390